MNQERKLQKKIGDEHSKIVEQEKAIKELTRTITLSNFANHAELKELVEQTQDRLSALEQNWAKAEEARDKLEKLQDQEEVEVR